MRYSSFSDFYPFYLNQHRNRTCRRLHFIGSGLVLVICGAAAGSGHWSWLWAAPVCGYGCAWVGHYFFEHNRPATFSQPWYSLRGDWVMFCDILVGRIRF